MNSDFVWKLVERFKQPMGFFLILVLTSILQQIFDMKFVCSCQYGRYRNIVLYMILPPLIVTLPFIIVKMFYRKLFFCTVDCCTEKKECGIVDCYTCKCSCRIVCFFCKRVLEYICPAAFWAAMVLFDGAWYFCLMTNKNFNQTGLPCKKKFTYEEERIRDSYKADSLDIGLGLCCCFLVFWCTVEIIQKSSCCNCWSCQTPYFEAKYQKILSEEISSYIKENLKEIAKTKAEEICKKKIEVIEKYERSNNNVNEVSDSEVWKEISDPKFLLKNQQEMTRNSQMENTTSDHPQTSGTTREGQEGPETAQDLSPLLPSSSSPPPSTSSSSSLFP